MQDDFNYYRVEQHQEDLMRQAKEDAKVQQALKANESRELRPKPWPKVVKEQLQQIFAR